MDGPIGVVLALINTFVLGCAFYYQRKDLKVHQGELENQYNSLIEEKRNNQLNFIQIHFNSLKDNMERSRVSIVLPVNYLYEIGEIKSRLISGQTFFEYAVVELDDIKSYLKLSSYQNYNNSEIMDREMYKDNIEYFDEYHRDSEKKQRYYNDKILFVQYVYNITPIDWSEYHKEPEKLSECALSIFDNKNRYVYDQYIRSVKSVFQFVLEEKSDINIFKQHFNFIQGFFSQAELKFILWISLLDDELKCYIEEFPELFVING